MTAQVSCIIRYKSIKILKVSKSIHTNSRWIYNNYHRHILTHYNNYTKSYKRKKLRKNHVLTDYFKESSTGSSNILSQEKVSETISETTYDVDKSDYQLNRVIDRTYDTYINTKSSK